MKICFIPIDNRPVCYSLAKDIALIDESVELFIPPRKLLGSLEYSAQCEKLIDWIKNIPECDAIIISLDTIAYGGLIPSRRSKDSFEDIKKRVENLKQILVEKKSKIYAFSSIMRISNNNYNEEEKEYWAQYGKKIFDYSYYTHKNGGFFALESCVEKLIPDDILNDYMQTRRRNFEINKLYLEWEKEGFFNTLIFSKDDCAEYGFNVLEAQELERLGAKTKTGADEIPLSLLAKSLRKEIKIFVDYTEPEHKCLISNYEDITIENTVKGQLELCGFIDCTTPEEADVILIVNNFVEKQGEHVMGWNTQEYNKVLKLPNKPYAIADVRYANGADNAFVNQLFENFDTTNFYGYAAWNTSANTLGSLLSTIKIKFQAKKYNNFAFKKLQAIRFLDDWAYQANIRTLIKEPYDISTLMKPYEEKIFNILDFYPNQDAKYTYPWNRKFEIEIEL